MLKHELSVEQYFLSVADPNRTSGCRCYSVQEGFSMYSIKYYISTLYSGKNTITSDCNLPQWTMRSNWTMLFGNEWYMHEYEKMLNNPSMLNLCDEQATILFSSYLFSRSLHCDWTMFYHSHLINYSFFLFKNFLYFLKPQIKNMYNLWKIDSCYWK